MLLLPCHLTSLALLSLLLWLRLIFRVAGFFLAFNLCIFFKLQHIGM